MLCEFVRGPNKPDKDRYRPVEISSTLAAWSRCLTFAFRLNFFPANCLIGGGWDKGYAYSALFRCKNLFSHTIKQNQ